MRYRTTKAHKAVLLAVLACIALVCTDAYAVSLYWARTNVNTASVKTCFSFAQSAMQALNMQNIRVSRAEVAGTRNNMYAALTCIGTAPRVTAMVMVAGEDGAATKALSVALQQKIAGTIKFDDAQ
jgi:hypothetical protein